MSDHKKTNCKTKYKIASYIGEVYRNSRQRIQVYDSTDNGNHILYEGGRGLLKLVDHNPEKCSPSAHEVIQGGFLQKHHR